MQYGFICWRLIVYLNTLLTLDPESEHFAYAWSYIWTLCWRLIVYLNTLLTPDGVFIFHLNIVILNETLKDELIFGSFLKLSWNFK